ncbi:MAG: phosphotransferase [Acidobacteria bacterium]|jgi:aminoglycoside/choline kinase family phosphotransferase|nr:phosphotransferase [Acidobacteriota bacterium]
MSQVFAQHAARRLEVFLERNDKNSEFELLTPDASTREYFRIKWNTSTAIACLYAEPFLSDEHNYLDITKLFLKCNLPVAKILDFDGEFGVIVLEDLGEQILRDVLDESNRAEREILFDRAISLIPKIQAATRTAFDTNSIASKLMFDREKLGWELRFFKTHFFETYRREELSKMESVALEKEFAELASELETRAKVLCHRDFHAANLMVDNQNRLHIIDHQDARIGTTSYDLVSILLDRVLEIPDKDWLDEKKRFFLLEREKSGLEIIEYDRFDEEFQLQTIQRCLKAIGTFSFQSVTRGKTYFIRYIAPMLKIVLQAAERLQKFPEMQKIIKSELNKQFR